MDDHRHLGAAVIFPETVTRLRAPLVTDRYGVSVRNWSAAAVLTISGVQVQPVSSEEPTDIGRAQVVTHHKLFSPKGVDLDVVASDRVRWNGVDYYVDGEIARWRDPQTGDIHHVEVLMRRVVG